MSVWPGQCPLYMPGIVPSKQARLAPLAADQFLPLRTLLFPMKWSTEGSPAVNNARFDPGVILPGAAEARVQILGLAPEGNLLVEPVVSTPSQGHREAVKG